MNKSITAKNLAGDALTYEIKIIVKLDVFMNEKLLKICLLRKQEHIMKWIVNLN